MAGVIALTLSLLPGAALAAYHGGHGTAPTYGDDDDRDDDGAATDPGEGAPAVDAVDPPQPRDIDAVCPVPTEVAVDGPSLSDIEGTTHEATIRCAVDYGFARGRTDGSYGSNAPITRGQAATILTNVIEVAIGSALPEPDAPLFSDSVDGVHATAINKLAEADVVAGRTDGSFGVGADINRGQMAAIVSNAIDLIDTEAVDDSLPAAVDQAFFEDVVDTRFQDEVQALAGVGIVQGVDAGVFSPGASVTRGQLATFVMRSVAFVDTFARFAPTAETVTFEVDLAGLNEVNDEGDTPEFDVGEQSATATATLVVDAFAGSIAWEVDFSEVTGPFDAAPGFHIHEGGLAENGPIVAFLATGDELQDAEGQTLEGTFEEDVEEFRFVDLVDDPDGYYLNLHSDAFPPGAVRGQLPGGGQDLLEPVTFEVTMTGEAEVENEGQLGASAPATLVVDAVERTITHTVDFSEVDGPFAAAPGYHIHVGAEDENGPIVLFLATGDELQAAADDDAVITDKRIEDVDPALLRLLITDPGNYYLNLHSNEFPPGAVRAQLDS